MPHRCIEENLTPAWRRRGRRMTDVRWLRVLALSSAAFIAAPAIAQSPPPAVAPEPSVTPADLDELRSEVKQQGQAAQNRIEADEAVIARLQEQLWAERRTRQEANDAARLAAEEAARASSATPMVHAGRLVVSLSGFVQIDATAWNQLSQDQLDPSTGDPLNQTRFNIKRARLRAQLDYRMIGGAVEFDGNTNNGYQARIIGAEAYLVWHNPASTVPWLELDAGSMKIPYGFEIQQRDTDRLFLERSTLEKAMFLGEYDLGARVFGGWHFLRYSLAAMNGDPIGEKEFPGRDPNQSKDIIGRVGIETIVRHWLGLAGDVSAIWGQGFHKGTPLTKSSLVWRDANQDGAVQLQEIQVLPSQAATPSENFTRWAIGGDLRFALDMPLLGQLVVYGEVTYAANMDRALVVADPVAATRDLRELGWYVAVTQDLTPWAAIGIRYDTYNPDRDANELRNGVQVYDNTSYSTLAVAAAVRYPGYARLIFEYDHNTNPLGRTADGTPTSLAADDFMIRAEVKF
ncbi:MAG TPA: hypothetical protein VGL86_12745 [Polyangia bacterium]